MHFAKSLLLTVSFAMAALAAGIQLTSVPSTVTPGVPTTLTWTGGDGLSVSP